MTAEFKHDLRLSGQVLIHAAEPYSTAITHGLRMLKRDLNTVLGSEPNIVADPQQAQIRIGLAGEKDSCPIWLETGVCAHARSFERKHLNFAPLPKLL